MKRSSCVVGQKLGDVDVAAFCNLDGTGMNKMVINHLDKLFVTHDAATIMDQLEVHHPAAKMIAMAAKSQEEEVWRAVVASGRAVGVL